MGKQPYKIFNYHELDSTNDFAIRNKDKFVFGDVIVADRQTNGHGRFNREWVSGSVDNIYMTIVLEDIEYKEQLPFYVAIVIARVLAKLGVIAEIKWPNDILTANKKISGILINNVCHNKRNFVVAGIGLNMTLSAEEKVQIGNPAISLSEIGVKLDKQELITLLLEEFFINLDSFTSKGFSLIKNEYEAKSSLIGKQITVKCSQIELTGKVIGFSDSGELLLEQDKVLSVSSGEVVKVL